MPIIDLKSYAIAAAGKWRNSAESYTPSEFVLTEADDEVTLAGPVSVNVTLQTDNATLDPSGAQEQRHYSDIFAYTLNVPPGQTWRYRLSSDKSVALLGANRGVRVLIRPGIIRFPAQSVVTATDLPCDYAVAPIRDLSQFFPAACEPCAPGSAIAMPPGSTPTLIAPASGGCVRTRFFNGMFITREDMETEQRYFRLKNKMQNRAMGQGVVWGLNVRMVSDGLCIDPGYAVDCCGNDLVVTAPYHVTRDALLRDPAGFQFLLTGGPRPTRFGADCGDVPPPSIIIDPVPQACRRMHLLLEYVECPEQPRPVHGDPCAPQASSCEMSRIRETVRLRLTPPRDYDPKGPIDKFLAELQDLVAQAAPAAAAPSLIDAPAGTPIPFEVALHIDPTPGHANLVQGFDDRMQPDRNVTVTRDLPNLTIASTHVPPNVPLRFRIQPATGFAINQGAIVNQQGATVASASAPPIEWTAVAAMTPPSQPTPNQPVVVENKFTFTNWGAVASTGQALVGSTTIHLRVTYQAHSNLIRWQVVIDPTRLQVSVGDLPPLPCFNEACACDPNTPLFPVFPPFLHNDPRSNQPVDWKVIVLAAVYGWLAAENARAQTQSAPPLAQQRAEIARLLYRTAMTALFGVSQKDARDRLTIALRCLFQAWCKALLYPGPECGQGIHGAVVGCVQIRGGRIVDVDPWGGRRWVVHYPLLSYWGHQFGIAPLDVTASRLFSLICCLGQLPLPSVDLKEHVTIPTIPTPIPTMKVANTFVLNATRAEALAALQSNGIIPVAVRELPLPEFSLHLLSSLREPALQTAGPYTLFALAGSPDVHFAAPVAADVVAVAAKVRPTVVDRLPEIVHSVDSPGRAHVPPLLRSLGDRVTAGILRAAPVSRITDDPQNPLNQKLGAAGLTTYGSLLAPDPEKTFRTVGSDNPREFSDLIVESEAVTAKVAAAVHRGVVAFSKKTEAASIREVTSAERIAALSEVITKELAQDKEIKLKESQIRAVIGTSIEETMAEAGTEP